MAKPPAGSSLLFGALADSGRIKERKNGSYRMVLKGVDEIDWFTDRPYRSEGLWKPQKLIRQWDSFFETSDPNAQASFKVGEERELITFEMFKPKYNSKTQSLSFKIDAEIINNRESDLITGLKGKALDEVTLFIDDATLSQSFTGSLGEPTLSNNDAAYGSASASVWNRDSPEIIGGVEMKDADAFVDMTYQISGITINAPNAAWYAPFTWFADSDLSGADLEKSELTGALFSNVDLTKVNLSHSVMQRSAFVVESSLDEANLSYAIAPASTFDVSLKSADMSNANLSNSIFSGDAAMADFSGARLDEASFWEANISGASFTSARMDKSYLGFVNASEADFTNANLAGAYFEEVNLTKALFDGADLTDVTWDDVTCPDGTKNIGTSPCTAAQLDVPM